VLIVRGDSEVITARTRNEEKSAALVNPARAMKKSPLPYYHWGGGGVNPFVMARRERRSKESVIRERRRRVCLENGSLLWQPKRRATSFPRGGRVRWRGGDGDLSPQPPKKEGGRSHFLYRGGNKTPKGSDCDLYLHASKRRVPPSPSFYYGNRKKGWGGGDVRFFSRPKKGGGHQREKISSAWGRGGEGVLKRKRPTRYDPPARGSGLGKKKKEWKGRFASFSFAAKRERMRKKRNQESDLLRGKQKKRRDGKREEEKSVSFLKGEAKNWGKKRGRRAVTRSYDGWSAEKKDEPRIPHLVSTGERGGVDKKGHAVPKEEETLPTSPSTPEGEGSREKSRGRRRPSGGGTNRA